MIVEPKIKGFICITAHPEGCDRNVESSIAYIESQGKINLPEVKNVLVIGCSTGYGLESAICSSFGAGANVIGVAYEKPPQRGRTATAGFYNAVSYASHARKRGLYTKIILGDAFSYKIKKEVVDAVKADFAGRVDMLIYSIAAPSRTDPETGIRYSSVLKPIGKTYTSKGIDLSDYQLTDVSVSPATEEEISNTVKVMGGEDLQLWVEQLNENNLLSDQATVFSYSYVGPDITHDIYTNGAIGKAKEHLKRTSDNLPVKSFVSMNKAVVTQSSAAIPVLPLYISILFKIMKERGTHENAVQQIYRLLANDYLIDENRFIRLDNLEMDSAVQEEVQRRWESVTNANLNELADLDGYKNDFLRLFGFGRNDVDYSKDVEIEVSEAKLKELNIINFM